MNEMKPEDVMRALECHCDGGDCFKVCPYFINVYDSDCLKNLVRDAFALLREKDARIKELWEERCRIYQDLQEWKDECKKYQDACREKDAEIERLRKNQLELFDIINKQKDKLRRAQKIEANAIDVVRREITTLPKGAFVNETHQRD